MVKLRTLLVTVLLAVQTLGAPVPASSLQSRDATLQRRSEALDTGTLPPLPRRPDPATSGDARQRAQSSPGGTTAARRPLPEPPVPRPRADSSPVTPSPAHRPFDDDKTAPPLPPRRQNPAAPSSPPPPPLPPRRQKLAEGSNPANTLNTSATTLVLPISPLNIRKTAKQDVPVLPLRLSKKRPKTTNQDALKANTSAATPRVSLPPPLPPRPLNKARQRAHTSPTTPSAPPLPPRPLALGGSDVARGVKNARQRAHTSPTSPSTTSPPPLPQKPWDPVVGREAVSIFLERQKKLPDVLRTQSFKWSDVPWPSIRPDANSLNEEDMTAFFNALSLTAEYRTTVRAISALFRPGGNLESWVDALKKSKIIKLGEKRKIATVIAQVNDKTNRELEKINV